MDSAFIIFKINDIERKLEKIQEELKKARSNSNDTENLIAEEVHWCIKLFHNFFVMHNVTCHNNIYRYTINNTNFDTDTDDSDYETEEVCFCFQERACVKQ